MQPSGSAEAQLQGWVLRMRGLPYTATASDVLGFFDGLELARGAAGVVFTCTSDGRPLGEAYVEFNSEEAQQAYRKLCLIMWLCRIVYLALVTAIGVHPPVAACHTGSCFHKIY